MRRDKDIRYIALQVAIALSAGMFSIVPTVSASPVLDHVVSGGAAVDQKTTPNVTEVTSTTRNNVIDWKDFSVAQGETVRFDGGAKVNNYLNIVSGPNISQIDGAIQGGKDVYIVNPNGVIFGNNASVDVGSLYVSTRPISEADYNNIDKTTGDMRPLADTASKTGGDIVNMGTVQANSVFVEGSNIKFMDVDEVRTSDGTAVNDNVTIQTMGAIRLGQDANKVLTSVRSKKAGSNYLFTQNDDTTDFKSISDLTGLTKIEDNLAGNYELRNNITIKSTDTFTPIGSTAPFTGKFDGNFYTVSGITVTGGTYGGLFGHTKGATISNVGVSDVNIKALYAGGIVGLAEAGVDANNNPKNTVLTNVFNQGGSGSISGTGLDYDEFAVGGIVGKGNGIEIDKAYNNATVEDPGSGILGYGLGKIVISNVYSTGTNSYDIMSLAFSNQLETGSGITNVITNNSNTVKSVTATITTSNIIDMTKATATEKKSAAYYSGKGLDISASGSDDTVWRIYEGNSTPLLRDILRRGNGAVTVNATYTHGDESIVNGGKDIGLGDGQIKMTYNGSGVTSTKDDATFTWNKTEKGQYHEFDENKVKVAAGNKNVALQSIFYCDDQFGYDLVGGNVEMAKRELNIDGQTLNYTHVYNGSADVTEELQGKIESGSAVGGIVAADENDLELTLTNFKATFVDADGKADANASDAYKDIKLEGTITLTKKDGASSSAMDNYAFSGDTDEDGSVTFGENSTAKGMIGRRTLYLNEATTPITKVYDGTPDVGSDFTTEKMYTLDKEEYFSGESAFKSGRIKYQGENGVTYDDVKLAYTENTPQYYDAVNSKAAVNANTNTNTTWQITYTGIALDGAAKGNYVLKYKEGTSEKEVDTTTSFNKTGTITPKYLDTTAFNVLDEDDILVKEMTKVYNGDEFLGDVPEGTHLQAPAELVTRDQNNIISFDLSTDESYFAREDGKATKDVADATKVFYQIKASSSDPENHPLSNYKISEDDDTKVLTEDALTISAKGKITRRDLEIQVKKDGIDKPYDGDSIVKEQANTDYTKMGGSYLNYKTNESPQVVSVDKASVSAANKELWTVTANYQAMTNADGTTNDAQDVYRVAGVPSDKNIQYTIKLNEDIAANYTINGKEAENAVIISTLNVNGTTTPIKGKITPITITPVFDKITKTYDGTAAINVGDANPNPVGVTPRGKLNNDDVYVDYERAYFNNANAGNDKQVIYETVGLKGTKSGNYDLDATAVVDGTAIGEGVINRRLILTDSFKVNDGKASKEYDGQYTYTLASGAKLTSKAGESGNTGIVTGDVPHLLFSLSSTVESYFTQEDGKTRARDAGVAKKVAYAVDVTAETGYEYLLGNYMLGSSKDNAVNLDDNSKDLRVSGEGEITPKKVYATVNGAVEKTYDSTPVIELEGEELVHIEGLLDDAATNNKTTAEYIDSAVGAGDATDHGDGNKKVKYTVKLADAVANNYIIYDNEKYTTKASDSDKFITSNNSIGQRDLTLTFADITKVYDGYDTYGKSTVLGEKAYKFTKLYGLDSVTIADGYTANAQYSNPNVENGAAKTVTYSKLTINGNEKGNYRLLDKDGVELKADKEGRYTATGSGTITKYTLTQAPTITFNHVNKEYDGKPDVVYSRNSEEDDPRKFINATIKNASNQDESLGFDLAEKPKYKYSYVNSNNDLENPATFIIKFSSDNYDFSNDIADDNFKKLDDGSGYQYIAIAADATISPRTITVSLGKTLGDKENHFVTKPYDGNGNVKQVITRDMFQFGEGDVLTEDTGKVWLKNNSDDGKGVKAEYTGPDNGKHVGDKKEVKYTLELDGTAKDNYVLNLESVKGEGDIKPRELTINLVNGVVAEKDYDGFATMADGTYTINNTNDNHFSIAKGGTDTGLVDGDTIKITGAKAIFADNGNVKRTPDGSLDNQEVTFSAFTLDDNDNGDYEVVTKTLTGSGLIKPIKVAVDVSTAAPDKEYNKNLAIEADDIAAVNANISVTPNNTINGKTVKDLLKITKGEYDDYNAAPEGKKSYWYEITMASPNYELVKGNGQEVTVNSYSQDKGFTLTLHEDTGGTIKPKKLTASVIGELTKTYDGDGIASGDADVGKHVKINEEIYKGDDIGLHIKAEFDNDPNAAASVDDAKPKPHDVKYTISLDSAVNKGNYVLDANSAELPGIGRINRKELTVTAEPVSIYAGDSVPDINTNYRGKVTGWAENDENVSFMTGLYYGTPYGEVGTMAQTAGTYAIYGWYINDAGEKIPSGNFGFNYKFVQAASNDTALTVNYSNNNTGNPDTKITPNNDIYNQISKDMSSGFGDNGAAAIEYQDKNGNVLAAETIDSGEIHGTGLEIDSSAADMSKQAEKMANIGIAGGDIVNMEGANAASNANISVSGDGTTVNLEVYSIKGEQQSEANNSVAEITNTDSRTGTASIENADNAEAVSVVEKTDTVNGGLAQIEIKDEKKDVLSEEVKDKTEEEEKEGEIAIKSSNGEDDDEIELTVEKEGVNVA